jgi:hypothetical protein
MSLQNQTWWSRRDSALSNAISDARFQTNKKTVLHENLRLDDHVDELQDYLRRRCRQQLKDQADELQNIFSSRQNRKKCLRDSINRIWE